MTVLKYLEITKVFALIKLPIDETKESSNICLIKFYGPGFKQPHFINYKTVLLFIAIIEMYTRIEVCIPMWIYLLVCVVMQVQFITETFIRAT